MKNKWFIFLTFFASSLFYNSSSYSSTLPALPIDNLNESLFGSYNQSCTKDDDDNYYVQYIDISRTHLEWKFIAFEDEKCESPYIVFKRTFKVVAISSSQVFTQSIDSNYLSLTDEVTRALNLIKYCSYKDWQTDKVKDVTGKKCDDYQQLKSGENRKIPYSLNGNKLFWDKTTYLNKENL